MRRLNALCKGMEMVEFMPRQTAIVKRASHDFPSSMDNAIFGAESNVQEKSQI